MADFEGDTSLLAVLLDLSPAALEHLAATPGLGLQSLLEQLLTFLNAFTLLSDGHQVAVFAAGGSGCQLAYCSPTIQPSAAGAAQGHAAGAMADPWPPSGEVLQGLQRVAAEALSSGQGGEANCQVSSALSRVLCFIHSMQRRAAAAAALTLGGSGGGAPSAGQQQQQQQQQQPARVLCLSAAVDVPSQYIGVMNAIFSAQRSGILIDTCQLGSGHSTFLQQAAYLTGGTYLKPAKPQALVQYLNSVFSVDAATRRQLCLPDSAHVDFRASCFCHKRQIDLGYVCSACLSIFCQQLPACTTCASDFHAGIGKQ